MNSLVVGLEGGRGAGSISLAADLGQPAIEEELVKEVQRGWLLAAMAKVVCEQGPESATVQQITARAGVTRRRFYQLFENREDCFRTTFESALAAAADRASAAYEAQGAWLERIRAGLLALLEFFDGEPELARLCVLHVTPANPGTIARRREVLAKLTEIIDEGRSVAPAGTDPPPWCAESVVGGVLAVIQVHLLEENPEPLTTLLSPLMSVIVLPYLGQPAARKELGRRVRDAARAKRQSENPHEGVRDLDMRVTYRTLRVLAAIAAAPGISNRKVAEAAGVRDAGQISKLLARLERRGLIRKTRNGRLEGRSNAWTVTSRGEAFDGARGTRRLMNVIPSVIADSGAGAGTD
jgi:AcrR family transcriptional regulator